MIILSSGSDLVIVVSRRSITIVAKHVTLEVLYKKIAKPQHSTSLNF